MAEADRELQAAGTVAAEAAGPRLVMRGVRKRFDATVALAGVDLVVAKGEVHALVGENGAGKSTLMKVLSGAIRADSGDMALDGVPYEPRTPSAARAAGVAMIYQELSLAPHMTVAENVALGVEPTRYGFVEREKVHESAARALASLGRPDIPPEARLDTLSVAEQQIVEIARAIASGARVIIFDEPTSSLTGKDVRKLFATIAKLKAAGKSIVYISHFIEEAMEVSDRFTVLRDGLTVGGGDTTTATVEGIVEMMVGRTVEELFPRSQREPGEEILVVEGLAGATKPESASLSLRRGEVLGIAGLVGAGRTELMRALFGLDQVRAGSVRVAAYVGPASPARRWAQGVGLVSEDRKGEGLAVTMTVADNVTLSRLAGLGPPGMVLPARQHAATSRWIERLGIRCRSPLQRVVDLSGGNQQKVAVARLLHHDADVWLLDEPTRGIDVGSKAEIYRLIDELASGSGGAEPDASASDIGRAQSARPKAILMVSSYIPELLGVCDRVAVMCRGRLGPARPVAELDEHSLMLEATGAEEAA